MGGGGGVFRTTPYSDMMMIMKMTMKMKMMMIMVIRMMMIGLRAACLPRDAPRQLGQYQKCDTFFIKTWLTKVKKTDRLAKRRTCKLTGLVQIMV